MADQPQHQDKTDDTESEDSDDKLKKALYYEINDKPPWLLTILLGFQHYLTMASGTVSVPFILTPLMCMANDDPNKANIISTIMFVSGIVTLLQSTFGTRLPIIQGGSFAFIVPSIAILALPEWKCPPAETIPGLPDDVKLELWQSRIREIQGAIILAALFEVFFGLFGFVGIILRFITPMTVAPAIAMIGLSLFKVAANHAKTNWPIALLTILMITVFSQYMKNVKLPIPFTKSTKAKGGMKRYPVFQVFPVLLTMGLVWLLCYILTATNVFSKSDLARTDVKTKIVTDSKWITLPYPFQWGLPTVSAGAVFGMLSGVLAGIIESIGDYYACARISGAPSPPTHAINRGIFIEGVGCVIAGIFGTGNGSTSYSENIGAISVTKVGSRRVIQAAGFLMIFCALIGKVGAVFISIPEPIIGGVFIIVFASVTAVGLANLQGVDLNSSRNIFIIGLSLFFGLVISQWMSENPGAIETGADSIDQIINVLLSTGMFVSGFLGFFLDNTIPGTREERGLVEWEKHMKIPDQKEQNYDNTYDIPLVMRFIRRMQWMTYVPISPTYENSIIDKCRLPTAGKKGKGVVHSNGAVH